MALEDRFEIGPPLHVGQMATAYPAVQKGLERKVLLKTLHPQWTKDPELVERFVREGKAMARIRHPNVVQVYDFGQDEGVIYLVLEWVDGATLRELLREGPLPSQRVKAWAKDLLAGLEAVHAEGLLHRDLKPDNILIDARDNARLTDFSLAGLLHRSTLTSHGALVGTPAYMAPELVGGRPPSPRSDLFGLGLVLLECLTGSNPYAADDPGTCLERLRTVPPPRLSGRSRIDPDLARLVDALLEPQPERRPSSAREALALLDGTTPLPPQRPKRRVATAVVPAVVGLALVTVLAVRVFRAWLEPTPRSLEASGVVPTPADSLTPDSAAPNLSPVRAAEVIEPAPLSAPAPVSAPLPPPPRPGALTLVVEPWAQVWIDGKYLGTSPLGTLEFPAGVHRVRLKHPEFPEIHREVRLGAGARDTLRVRLQDETAALVLAVSPWGYLVVDGDTAGLLPTPKPVRLAPGRHYVEVRHPTLPTWAEWVEAAPGGQLAWRIDLKSGTKIAIQ